MFKPSDFTFIKTIGSGTFGRVFLVQLKNPKLTNNKFYALKILKKYRIARLRQVNHTIDEKNILVECRVCPFIVKIEASFVTSDAVCMLLEYVCGGELFYWIKKYKRFKISTVKFYAAQIIFAIEHIHNKGAVFRDIKPENILLGRDGYLKLTDFGFAKFIEETTFTICGTPDYMAPEELEGKGHGKAVDYWALGILLYEMAIGAPPFCDETSDLIYEKILTEKVEFPPNFNFILEDLINRLLNRDPSKRLGAINGIQDIKDHYFFADLDWDAVYNKRITPPIMPPVQSDGDTQNFIDYDDYNPVFDVPTESLYKYYRFW